MRGVLEAYRRVLRNRPLSRLLLGEFVSSIGDWLYLVALLIIVYTRTQDAALLGVVGAARVLPYVIFSIPAGILADRVDRRLILLVTDLARGALMFLLAGLVVANASIEAIVAVTIVATCFSSFFGPAIGAYLPSLVPDESDLGPANTAYATLENVAFIVGPALAAVILSFADIALAFVINGLTFLLIAAVLWTLPSSRAGQARGVEPAAEAASTTDTAGSVSSEREAHDAAVRAGFDWRAVAVPIGGLLVFDLVESFVFGGIGVLTVVIAFGMSSDGEAATGALNAAVGVGGLIGAVISGVLVLRRKLAPPLLVGAAVMGGSVLALGQISALGLGMLVMGASALGSLLVGIVSETLFQRIVPDEVRGRALGILETISVLVYALGALLLPTFVDTFGLGPVLALSGVAILGAAVVTVVLLGPWAVHAPREDALRATIERVAIFAGLAPARIETAERRALVVSCVPGQVIIRQGEPADRFYIIAEGEVEITQTGADGEAPRILRRMSVAEVFGEIGLLTGVPRTATVTAVTACSLLALERPDFLELANSGQGLSFPLLDLHRGASPANG